MARILNFSAGPAVLPEPVLQQAAAEMLDWHGSGMSVMEMSHRGKEFMGIAAEAETDLRELMGIPANYKVLFMQGGAMAENAIVPMNLLRGKTNADYIKTPRHRYRPELVNYERQPVDWVRAVPFGTGFIDYAAFFKGLRDGGFDGIATFEMCSPLRGGGDITNLDACATTYLNWMRGQNLIP